MPARRQETAGRDNARREGPPRKHDGARDEHEEPPEQRGHRLAVGGTPGKNDEDDAHYQVEDGKTREQRGQPADHVMKDGKQHYEVEEVKSDSIPEETVKVE